MNKNIIIKSIAAFTILTSMTGVGTSMVEGIQQTAKAEHNVVQIKNTKVAPYNSIFRIGRGTGFLIGKNTIITNKHVVKDVKIGDPVTAHPNDQKDIGGFYKIKNIIEYPGNSDLAIVHIDSIAYYPKGQKLSDHTEILKLSNTEAKVNDRISIVGYPNWHKNKNHMYESTGKVLSVKENIIVSDAYTEPGNSGSVVLNSKYEVVAVHFAGYVPKDKSKNAYGVYFSPEIKKFIVDNLDK
ncbi:trypsin-like serine peptidase [Staphylococcus schweitzeri]|uniref:trypsin-like serine peptidase n=1 Tax=Staphylococcus schweitzeri TaxID=1654388 RepID=UPI0005010728|nr:serine protease [Staphylococcus schweitzeri]CDR66315.1 serine protease SplE [Staphylococcus schweitzeri]